MACAWSTYLHASAQRAVALGVPVKVGPVELLWLQRHHYVGRAIGAGLNTLLLDSDVLLSRSPYPYFKAPPFSQYEAIVLGDATGSAQPLQINGGVWCATPAPSPRPPSHDGPARSLHSIVCAFMTTPLSTPSCVLL